MKNNKGITLVALVVTIIVLLILAGITIAMLTGDNGLLGKAQQAADTNEIGRFKDEVAIAQSTGMATYLEAKYTRSLETKTVETKDAETNAVVTNTVSKTAQDYVEAEMTKLADNFSEVAFDADKHKVTITSNDYTTSIVIKADGTFNGSWSKVEKKSN